MMRRSSVCFALLATLAVTGCGGTTIINRTVAAPTTTTTRAGWPGWIRESMANGCRKGNGTPGECECIIGHAEAHMSEEEAINAAAHHELASVMKLPELECAKLGREGRLAAGG
jgi:uncharacterized protein YceK